ncbi:hypothetical protein [Actinacidiphila sp. bgisy160]|uniref:hypothetical protein n=1 Tax=Actinacidiphila sp. bgisy160 TaxID=3413796 RepID=UPI003D719DF6
MASTPGVPRPDQAAKRKLLEPLDVQAGQSASDVGRGPGTGLPALAERVGVGGTVIGADRASGMLARARERTKDRARWTSYASFTPVSVICCR